MNRENAVAVMKEIGEACKLLSPQAIMLEETCEAGHFEIHINCHMDDETWECLKELAKKHSLGVRLTDHKLVIYAPVEKERVGS